MATIAKINFEGREYNLHGHNEKEHIYKGLLVIKTFYEIALLEWIRSLKIKGTYIDIGSNIGNHSIFFAAECLCDFVIAIEAYKPVFDLCVANLKENVDSNKYKTHHIAIGNNNDGKLSLWTPSPLNMGRARKAIEGKKSTDFGMRGETINVDCIKLDNLMKQYPEKKIGLIKIDIEGMEVEAIESGMEIIKTHKPVIVSECSIGRTENPNREMNQIDALLKPLGYVLVKAFGPSSVGPVFVWMIK